MPKKIKKLIINSPYEEPTKHLAYIRETQEFELIDTRRPAGYLVASRDSQSFDDPGDFVEISLVNRIRKRVGEWRERGYPGVSGITLKLLQHWTNQDENIRNRFFYCQLEAIETLIWLLEAPASEKVGIEIPSDGGNFHRLCSKMATGSGKTVVMAMLIAWQVLNKVISPKDNRFSKNILVITPGLTVRKRLSVLNPREEFNYFSEFDIIPTGYSNKLQDGKVLIRNWHALNWETDEKIRKRRSVDKRGALSDEAYVRSVLGDLSKASNILVINDEAHHAWRKLADSDTKGVDRAELETATKWVGSLDRINRTRGISTCYDFSATPFVPSGKLSTDEALFDWIVSDFGLNDAIESGLVKTPRVVVRDNSVRVDKSYMSRLYHIYNDPEVKEDLNRNADQTEQLPQLVTNAYYLLGLDWLETKKEWESGESKEKSTPPVMITVTNRTETASRVKYAFDNELIQIKQLCDPERTLHIDSKVLKQAEEADEPIASLPGETNKATKGQSAEFLRQKVDSVGKPNTVGEHIQNVISVQMLSEGWDAKTVTHIMGLRAFSSQLLCEQVVGRGLRRTAYDLNEEGLLGPEYVNIFGIPFTFLPHESGGGSPPPPQKPATLIEPCNEKSEFEISWPNVLKIDSKFGERLTLEFEKLKPLTLDASDTIELAELAPIVGGKPDMSKIEEIKLEDKANEIRLQRITFEAAKNLFKQMESRWGGNKSHLIGQLIQLFEQFMNSDKLRIKPKAFSVDDLKRRLVLSFNMLKIVEHIRFEIKISDTTTLEPIFDRLRPIASTADMQKWYTRKPCESTKRSHINKCVYDSTWEASDAHILDSAKQVHSWAKNDHLDFKIYYVYKGVVRKYLPDFLVKLKNGEMLILETKGKETEKDKEKFRHLQEWVSAINSWSGHGKWHFAVSRSPGELRKILKDL